MSVGEESNVLLSSCWARIIWSSGIDCAHDRNAPPLTYTHWYSSSSSSKIQYDPHRLFFACLQPCLQPLSVCLTSDMMNIFHTYTRTLHFYLYNQALNKQGLVMGREYALNKWGALNSQSLRYVIMYYLIVNEVYIHYHVSAIEEVTDLT